ncbi:MAG: hypothetical protein ACR2NP_05930 [Pirellulaceae bacterium]
MKIIAFLTLLAVSFPVALMTALPQQEEKKSEQEEGKSDRIIIDAMDENAIARRDFMRTKLMYAQNILEGLNTHDFGLIATAIKDIEMVTEGEQWVTIDNEVYQGLVQDFKKSVLRLKEAAATENIDATALRFYDMSNRCIDCHKHLETAQYDL